MPNTTWFSFASSGATGSFDKCSAEGVFGVLADYERYPLGGAARWQFFAPRDTAIAGIRLWRFVRATPTLPDSGGLDYEYQLLGDDAYTVVEQAMSPAPTVLGSPYFDQSRMTEHMGLDEGSLSIVYTCGHLTGAGTRCGAEDFEQVLVWKTETVLADSQPPVVAGQPTGSLLSPGVLSGTATLSLAASDRGGGLYSAELEVDGKVLTTSQFGSGCHLPFTQTVPCPLQGSATLTLDTKQLTDGPHQVDLVVKDATRSNRAVAGPYQVVTHNGPPPPVPEPAPAPKTANGPAAPIAVLHARFVKNKRATLRLSPSHTSQIEGQLLDQLGRPIGGALVEVAVKEARTGADYSVLPAVTTGPGGTFVVQIPAGPSRDVRLGYRAYLEDQDLSAQTVLHVVAPAPVTLRASRSKLRNGQSVTFCGSIADAGEAKSRVELEAWGGNKWITFRTVALKNGAFAARYRFTSTFRRTRYRFRAVAHADPSLPYTTGTSKVVGVVVRP